MTGNFGQVNCHSAIAWTLLRAFYAHPKLIFGIALLLVQSRGITCALWYALEWGDCEWGSWTQWLICIGAGVVGIDRGDDMDRDGGYGYYETLQKNP